MKGKKSLLALHINPTAASQTFSVMVVGHLTPLRALCQCRPESEATNLLWTGIHMREDVLPMTSLGCEPNEPVLLQHFLCS
jgi:hypothetical protein